MEELAPNTSFMVEPFVFLTVIMGYDKETAQHLMKMDSLEDENPPEVG